MTPRIRVLADLTLAAIGEFYVSPMTTEDGRRSYRAAVFARSCVGGFTTDAMGEWTTSLAEACDDAVLRARCSIDWMRVRCAVKIGAVLGRNNGLNISGSSGGSVGHTGTVTST